MDILLQGGSDRASCFYCSERAGLILGSDTTLMTLASPRLPCVMDPFSAMGQQATPRLPLWLGISLSLDFAASLPSFSLQVLFLPYRTPSLGLL